VASGTLRLFDAGYTAQLSPCGRYRYTLTRAWPGGLVARVCLFVMLNPSTADAHVDDPTIRKCVAFASHWGFSVLEVCNLFAWRAREPTRLIGVADPVGPENDAHTIRALSRAHRVVVAWGAHQKVRGLIVPRERVVEPIIRAAARVREMDVGCLGQNADGSPKHPLFLSVPKTEFTPWVVP
jgi:hypothetical protein